LLSVVAQALLSNFCVQVPPLLSFPAKLLTAVTRKSRLQALDSVLEPVVGVELPKEVFTSRAR
jgi:hypothetical protein